MCYYNGVVIPTAEFIRLKQFEIAINNRPEVMRELVSGFDYTLFPVLRKENATGKIGLVNMEWGFLPSYISSREKANQFRLGYKKPDGKWQPPFTSLNAKGEELLLPGKIFREAALSHRCLILSSGFYEWRHIHPINSRTGKPLKTTEKYPYYITIKNHPYFFIAGIWQPWYDCQTGEYAETFSMITTKANSLMSQIHNTKQRMPAVLNEDLAYRWLLEELSENDIKEIATFQIKSDEMATTTIAKNFRESSTPTKKFDYPNLPALEQR